MKVRPVIIILTITILYGFAASGQISKARKEMSVFNYSEAVRILQKAVKKNDSLVKREATILLAECYRKQNDAGNAVTWYAKVAELPHTDPVNLYYYAQSLRSCGRYGEAKNIFLKYSVIMPSDPNARLFAAWCDSVISWTKLPPKFEIRNAAALNTKQSEFGPAFFDSGIIFASDRQISKLENKTYGWTGNEYLRLFYSARLNKGNPFPEFDSPRLAPGLFNQAYHDGPATFDSACNEVFINRTLTYKDKGKKDPGHLRTHLLKIFSSTRKNNKWSSLQPFFLNNDTFSVGHPALSPDGKFLYFVSDTKGGYGGTDIYVCSRENEKWSHPVNLGPVVNTSGNEMFPFITAENVLYFASDGLPGFGGLDLFVTRNMNGNWSKPGNLGLPVNSSRDDFSLALYNSDSTGLFSSNRPGGAGSDDIYAFHRLPSPRPFYPPLVPAFISGCVRDKTTREPIPEAMVFILDGKTNKILVIKTNHSGCFKTPVAKGCDYTVKAMQTGFIPDCLAFAMDSINSGNDLEIPRDLLLDKLEINKVFRLDNIYYDFDKWNIRRDAEPSLNTLVRIMKENPVNVELGSHTDCRGSVEYNDVLSQKRAESAVQYIIHQGIDPGRITAKGYGKSNLINKCNCTRNVRCTEAEHQANRRTEFKVLSISLPEAGSSFDLSRFKDLDMLDAGSFPSGFYENCNKSK